MDIASPLRKEVWKRFVREGSLDESRINKRIAESWHLCRHAGVNPYNGKGEKILSKESLMKRKTENQKLLKAALPFIKKLETFFNGTKSMFLLVDPEGYVLYANGHEQAVKLAESINFHEGVKWTEDEVGTNAIGTALRIKEPITVMGTEHFSIASQQWVCSSAPILVEEGLAGVLDVSYPIDHYIHEHILAMVVAASYAIEQQLQRQAKEDELELLEQIPNVANLHVPILFCNPKEQVVWMNRCLHETFSLWHGLQLRDIALYGYHIQERIPVYSSAHHELIGYRIHLENNHPTTKSWNFSSSFHFDGVRGTSKEFERVLKNAERAAKTDAAIHIWGETGTGKEVLARSIHLNSSRKEGPFIAVNCGAIPKELMASELFGFMPGSFTGAKRSGHKGKFEQANGGTLFLDEIGEIPHEMQVALLRVLQEKQIVPIGGTDPVPLDVRVITATHRDLRELVRKGTFREDLFYRIFVYPIHIPPLRERKEDLPSFIHYYCEKNNWLAALPKEVMDRMMEYGWPGNVRELFNFMERLRIHYGNDLPRHFSIEEMIAADPIQNKEASSLGEMGLSYRERMEKKRMIDALEKTRGNVSLAASKLQMARSTFYRKMKKYHL